MDGKLKHSRRSRSQRDRVRRRDAIDNAQNRSPSSGSDRRQSPAMNKALRNYGKCTHLQYVRPPRPSRRKRRGSVSQEEDIIDGFAIASFLSLDQLELALRKRTKSLRLQEGKEKWERQVLKRQKTESALIPVNGFKDNEADYKPEQDGEKKQGKVKTCSKKNKQVKGPLERQGRAEVTRAVSQPQRSNSKDHHSESSYSGRGYSCDSESEIDDKVSAIESEKLFTLKATCDPAVDEKDEAKVCSSARVSGLQRSQEESSEAPCVTLPPVSSPTPAPQPAGSPAPAASLTNAPTTPPPLVRVKKERTSPHIPSTTPTLQGLAQVKREPQVPSSHQQAHSLYTGLHSSSSIERSRKRTHPQSPRLGRHSSPSPALPLSITELPAPHYFLPGQGHRRPAMFISPLSLPTNGIVGHPTGAGYIAEHDLLRQELNNRFLVQSAERGGASGTPPLRAGFHQHTHQHQHQHQHQHTHQVTFTPYSTCVPPAGILTPPSVPTMGHTAALNLEKYPAKLENPYLRHSNFFPSYPPAMPGMPALLPHSAPFSSLQGAFQPKANLMDMATRPGDVPHTLLPKDPRITDPFRARKAGRWCAVHAQIAWQIHHHQQRMKHMSFDPHKMSMSGRLDLFSRPAGPGLPPGLSFPHHDLTRPLLSSPGNLSASPFNALSHHTHYLPPSHRHLPDPFKRVNNYGVLGNMAGNVFGGLGIPSLGPSSPFGGRQVNGLPGFGGPPHGAWNRLHRTPPSFPTPPPLLKSADVERKQHNGERERETKKRDYAATKEESERDRNSQERNHQSASGSYQISSLIGSSSPGSKRSSPDRGRQAESLGTPLGRVQIKQSSSPGPEIQDRAPPDPYITAKNEPSRENTHTLKGTLNIKQERRDDPEAVAGTSDMTVLLRSATPGLPHPHSHAPHPSRRSNFPTAGFLQGSHLPHSLPLSMSPMHPVSSLSALERGRVQPFMGISPLAPHLSAPWDPLRDSYRGLYMQSQQSHMTYDPDRGHRQREPQPQQAIQDRHRQAEERVRLHQLQGSPMEGHLAHTPPYMTSLGGVMYPRLSPSAPHSGHLNRTPPTATLSAPPPLVSMATGTGRPASPRRTTPTSAPPSGDLAPSCKPKQVEAQ